jgi:inorganic pyrophosphatase
MRCVVASPGPIMTNYHSLATFADDLIRVVIETPKGAAAKFSYEPKADLFEFGRALPAGIIYPYDWGFIPSTLGEDGDALDGLVVHHTMTAPGIVIKCHLLGALLVEQTEDGKTLRNDRFVLYPARDSADDAAQNGVPQRLKKEIEQFFQASILGSARTIKFDGWQSADDALKAIRKGQAAFERKHGRRK